MILLHANFCFMIVPDIGIASSQSLKLNFHLSIPLWINIILRWWDRRISSHWKLHNRTILSAIPSQSQPAVYTESSCDHLQPSCDPAIATRAQNYLCDSTSFCDVLQPSRYIVTSLYNFPTGKSAQIGYATHQTVCLQVLQRFPIQSQLYILPSFR